MPPALPVLWSALNTSVNPERVSLPAETLGMGSLDASGICAKVAWKFRCDVAFDLNMGHGSHILGALGNATLDFCLNIWINALLCFPSKGLSFGSPSVIKRHRRVFQKVPCLQSLSWQGGQGRGKGTNPEVRGDQGLAKPANQYQPA